MLDLQTLRILKHKDEYHKVINRVPKEAMDKTTVALLRDFGKYFKAYPEDTQIVIDKFMPLFTAWHPKLTDEQRAAYVQVIKRIKEDVSEDDANVVMHSLLELRLSSDMANLLLKYEAGDVENIHAELEEMATTFKRDAKVKGLDFVRPDIDELLTMEANEAGLSWRLGCLNSSMRGLRDGDFGIIAGRPDKGKTTFLVSEVTKLAEQTDRPVIWLNNEGPGQRIYTRLWQAALGATMSQIVKLHHEKKLMPAYEAAIKGPQDKIRVFDIHGMDTYAVERIIESNGPAVVVYDMIDNIRGFGSEARTDLALEKQYQWAREMCVKHEHVGLATSQISVEGAGLQFPADHMLKDSKTGKQGACDFILMIGTSDDPGFENSRFIGLPKNKLRREGNPGDPRETVHYRPQIARYTDILVSEEL